MNPPKHNWTSYELEWRVEEFEFQINNNEVLSVVIACSPYDFENTRLDIVKRYNECITEDDFNAFEEYCMSIDQYNIVSCQRIDYHCSVLEHHTEEEDND